jgi:hypothetical protein
LCGRLLMLFRLPRQCFKLAWFQHGWVEPASESEAGMLFSLVCKFCSRPADHPVLISLPVGLACVALKECCGSRCHRGLYGRCLTVGSSPSPPSPALLASCNYGATCCHSQ